MPKGSLFAMLDNAMKTLLTVLDRRVPERVKSVVSSINQDTDTPQAIREIKPRGVESPKVKAVLAWVLHVKSMASDPVDYLTTTIVFQGVLRRFLALENTTIGLPVAAAKSPMRTPSIKHCMEDSRVDTGRDKTSKIEQTLMDARAVLPWGAA